MKRVMHVDAARPVAVCVHNWLPNALRIYMRPFVLLALIALGQSAMAFGQAPPDVCRTKIPSGVAQALMNRFSGYRLPLVTDNLDEDVRFAITNSGDGCLCVASGDFDGDGVRDFAVGLTPTSGAVPVVAVALSRSDGWHLSTIASWVDDRERLFVAAVPSGVYTRSESLDTPLQRGEMERLRCRHAAIAVGATESTTLVYCYTKKRWTYVWVSE